MSRIYPSCLLLSVLLLSVSTGCIGQNKDAIIADIVKGGLSVKSDVLSSYGGIFSDYDVYRDGEADGVVFEYVYAADAIIDRSEETRKTLEEQLKSELVSDADSRKPLEMGIYTRFIYKSFEGEVICDVTVTKDDL